MFDSSKGSGFQAGAAQIDKPVDVATAQGADAQTQQALAQQQSFAQALAAQNGVQNQSGVFNQLQGVANGTGPNPAQAMLANQTGQNVANQAALMAAQRGSGGNVGLMARQAAMMGGNLQQQAAGQGAQMQAQQSLSALGQMGSMAGQQVAQQQGANQTLISGDQARQGQLLGQISAQNNAAVGMQSNQNNANASIANTNAQAQQGLIGGLAGAAGQGLGIAGKAVGSLFAHGGQVGYADGGDVVQPEASDPSGSSFLRAATAGLSAMGSAGNRPNAINQGVQNFVKGAQSGFAPSSPAPMNTAPGRFNLGANTNFGTPMADPMQQAPVPQASSFQAPAMQAPMMNRPTASTGANIAFTPLSNYAQGGAINGEQLAAQGKMVPGQAKVAGDSETNDTVDAKLSPGEVVIPRSVMQSADPVREAAKFVAALLQKNKAKK